MLLRRRPSSRALSVWQAIGRSLDDFFTALPGNAPVEALAAEAGRLMDGAEWDGQDLVDAAAPGTRLLPAARNEKERLRVRVVLDDGTALDAILGLTRALDERGRPVTCRRDKKDGVVAGTADAIQVACDVGDFAHWSLGSRRCGREEHNDE